jgi:hypothetical protein
VTEFLPVPRLHQPDPQLLARDFLTPERPVIITGVVQKWPAFSRWTVEYLRSALGSRMVAISESPVGDYFNASDTYGESATRDMPWAQFIESVFERREGDPVRYLRQRSISEFAHLADDIIKPAYITRPLVHTNLWIGAAPSLTVTHYDSEDNFLAQVCGQKLVTLFPSSQLRELYPYPSSGGAFNHSQVDIDNPDLARHPRFASATPHRCTLGPGDMLYIPIYWWHQVRTLQTGVSVNMWWKPLPSQARRVNGLRFLRASLRAGHFLPSFASMLPEPMGDVLMSAYRRSRALLARH